MEFVAPRTGVASHRLLHIDVPNASQEVKATLSDGNENIIYEATGSGRITIPLTLPAMGQATCYPWQMTTTSRKTLNKLLFTCILKPTSDRYSTLSTPSLYLTKHLERPTWEFLMRVPGIWNPRV